MAEKVLSNTQDKGTLEELVTSLERSHISIGQRIEPSKEHPYGFKYVHSIPSDKVAVLFLGGTGTEVRKGGDRSANGYLSSLEGYLKGHGLEEILQQQGKDPNIKKGIGLYSVIYNFGREAGGREICQTTIAREKLYADYKQIISLNKEEVRKDIANLSRETKDPHYIDELFNMAFLSRICDRDGKRLPVDEACKCIRNLTVCAHCHGAYTFLKIEEKMQQKMQQLGYSKEECDKIQNQLLCVVFAPDVPLGISKSKMISFASAYDAEIRDNSYQKNNFKRMLRLIVWLKEENEKKGIKSEGIKPSYLPGRRGEVFLVEKIYDSSNHKNFRPEHNFLNDKDTDTLTNGGKTLFNMAANAILNGIQSSLKKTPLPSVEELVCGQDNDNKATFQKLKANGEELWGRMKKDIRTLLIYQYRQRER